MRTRIAVEDDLEEILKLFKATIQHVNKQDYSREQQKAWKAGANDTLKWLRNIQDQYFLAAISGAKITGFGSITSEGYLDTLFVDKDHQREGIASTLLEELEYYARQKKVKQITSDVSITARPFFETCGFTVIKEQQVERNGVFLINYKMGKSITPR